MPGLDNLIAGGVTTGVGIAQANKANKKNRQFAHRQAVRARRFQAKREDTAVQRRMADLKAAGLNPILAATSGSLQAAGSGVTSAGSVQQTDTSKIGSDFTSGRRVQQELQNMKAQQVLTGAQVGVAGAQKTKLEAEATGQVQVNAIRQPATDLANVINTVTGAAKGQKEPQSIIEQIIQSRPAAVRKRRQLKERNEKSRKAHAGKYATAPSVFIPSKKRKSKRQ